MAHKLKETYGTLEKKVEEKTAELSNQVVEVEKSKSAILNLLEDIEEAVYAEVLIAQWDNRGRSVGR